MEKITIYLVGRSHMPITFRGKYLGHKRPDGKETKNWHYYQDEDGSIHHFRKEQIQYVHSKTIIN